MEITFPPITHSLMVGCINKNRDSQKKLYDLLSPLLYGKTIHAGFSKQQAEDLSTTVFIAIFNTIGQYDHSISFEDWVLKVYEKVLRMHRAEDEQIRNIDFKPSARREKRDSLQ